MDKAVLTTEEKDIIMESLNALNEVSHIYVLDRLSKIPVTLEISQEMAFREYEELSNIVVADNGTLLCNIEVSDINWFTSYVLSYGSHIRVLKHKEIKEKVMQEIGRRRRIIYAI